MQGLILTAAFLLIAEQPASNAPPTPQQKESAELAAAKSEVYAAQRDLSTFQVRASEDTFYSVMKAVLLTGGGLVGFGGWLAAQMRERHKNALERARVEAELKAADRKSETDAEIALGQAGIHTDNAVIAALQAEVKRQGSEITRLYERLNHEEKLTREMRDELYWLSKHGTESGFAEINLDEEDKVAFVTSAFVRHILDPMGKKRDDIIRKPLAEIFPPEVYAQIKPVRDEAFLSPIHEAWRDDVVFHPKMESHVVGITRLRQNDRSIGISLVAFPSAAKIDPNNSSGKPQ